jgi:hypothetical protein
MCVHIVYHIKQASKANESSFINLTDCVILFFSFQEFAFKRIFNESALRDSQSRCQVLQCHINHVRSVGEWPPSLNTFSNIRFFFLTYLHCACVRGYICQECYGEVMSVCTLFYYIFFFFSFLSMWSVWWLLYINYRRIERKTERRVKLVFYRMYSYSDDHKW